jgi:hypothetical protein
MGSLKHLQFQILPIILIKLGIFDFSITNVKISIAFELFTLKFLLIFPYILTIFLALNILLCVYSHDLMMLLINLFTSRIRELKK